ncbi:hypothetical protein KFK09_021236 [Dendrobium nobile]|uniref:Uncharacterized protein n=1 Tax=Dendrobium nobile TaxID=94219 RepID=A0A8T3AVA5_DENNO|nr:hypothetical protein KFK09_021236 [Dendrobium nobile]
MVAAITTEAYTKMLQSVRDKLEAANHTYKQQAGMVQSISSGEESPTAGET